MVKKSKGEGGEKTSMYDTIIIGAGVTGLATAMYAGRLNLKALVLGTSSDKELPIGGVITLTNVVENYPGFIHLTGFELVEKLLAHAKDYDIEIKEEKASGIKRHGDCFTVETDKDTYMAKTIIFATGAKWRKLPMKGGEKFENRGVHYCSLCDAALYKNKITSVVGGSDTAAKEALVLAEHAKKVYIIYRGEKIRPEPVNAKLVEKNPRIEVILKTNIVEIKGDKFVKSVVLDRPYKGKKELPMDAVFGAIGHIPLSGLAKDLGVRTNDKGEIVIDHKDSTTNVPGVFAAGDVADKEFKQAITGVAEGVTAAYSAFTYVQKGEFVCVFEDKVYKSKNRLV